MKRDDKAILGGLLILWALLAVAAACFQARAEQLANVNVRVVRSLTPYTGPEPIRILVATVDPTLPGGPPHCPPPAVGDYVYQITGEAREWLCIAHSTFGSPPGTETHLMQASGGGDPVGPSHIKIGGLLYTITIFEVL